MKKYLLSLIILLSSIIASNAQVVFSKFELKKNGYVKEVKGLNLSFTHEKMDQDLKYLKIDWYAVNPVGDVTDGQISGLDKNHTGIFLKTFSCVGPIPTGKKRYSSTSHAVITPLNVTAIPVRIRIIYMDNTEKVIEINKENYKQYFPKLKWIDYTKPEKD